MSASELLEKIAQLDKTPSDVPIVPPAELVGFFVRLVRGMRQWKQTTSATRTMPFFVSSRISNICVVPHADLSIESTGSLRGIISFELSGCPW